VRLIVVALSLFGIGTGIFAYIIAAIVIPNEPDIFIE
jgi:phage shock protein PspC (stress-responsive transcriptional regulator)